MPGERGSRTGAVAAEFAVAEPLDPAAPPPPPRQRSRWRPGRAGATQGATACSAARDRSGWGFAHPRGTGVLVDLGKAEQKQGAGAREGQGIERGSGRTQNKANGNVKVGDSVTRPGHTALPPTPYRPKDGAANKPMRSGWGKGKGAHCRYPKKRTPKVATCSCGPCGTRRGTHLVRPWLLEAPEHGATAPHAAPPHPQAWQGR